MTKFSILDLCPVVEGGTISQALDATRQMAKKAEAAGYTRFWLAEHHGMTGIASAATSLVISEAARATSTIRVGSGGIMLPNHSPLVIAEQFGTLEALYPGRIDLGLGRAPGTDMNTARALRRNLDAGAQTFPNDIVELQQLMDDPVEGQRLLANPGAGAKVPIYILGSSTYSAHLAAMLGLPYAFASHFAPDMLFEALHIYRTNFKPSAQLEKPYVIVGVMGAMADSDDEADYLFTSALQSFVALRRNARGKTPRPVESMDGIWTEMEKMSIEHTFQFAVVGGPEKARAKMAGFVADTKADEVIISVPVHSVEARLKAVGMFGALRSELKEAA
ncbi:MAG: alkane 1-monooxygenase [Martelella sp.]|uniref:LLM class flavin-dependent oxidoreductase n=1 Tax=unclassified Martelella TaxID=2629616 RepID=UPI000C35B9EC|nr:LLM class flavin-dependent oxidoreductase [Martelella sp.]MAU20711.1 alkane 1-monooxygenase [Martelella sp.]|tara:strand:+ start:3351 stop:4352 length:1002 start_codon:yes stop_codon:yes gene_type:complete